MAESVELIEDFRQIEPKPGDKAALLLGNGFSIACDSRYSYQALRDHAEGTLPEVSLNLLDRLGTSNLEAAMQILEDARWVAAHLRRSSFEQPLAEVHQETRLSLVRALAEDHLRSPRDIDHEGDAISRSSHAVRFLGLFDRLFTINYDLLLYWTMMKDIGTEQDGYKYRDGFKRPENESYGEFDLATDPNVFYLHGALHLYSHDSTARKHLRAGSKGLVEIVQQTVEAGDFPLFVAGGRPEQKMETIRNSPYLKACFESFAKLEGRLVVYGWSLGPSDQHLLDSMASNPALESVCLSYHGEVDSPANLRLRATAAELQQAAANCREVPLEVQLFPSESARVWG